MTPAEAPIVAAVYTSTGLQKQTANFSAAWVGAPPVAIDLKLDLSQLAESGVYDIWVALQPSTNPTGPRLKIQISHATPKLAPVAKLIIDRNYWFIGISTDALPPLTLHEASKRSSLTGIGFAPTANTTLNNKSVSGTLSLTAPASIDRGADKQIPYSLAGDFGIGNATGTVRIDATELTDPAGTFDFEVRSHVHWMYIGITIVIGLIVSYLLKVRLQQRIELDQAVVDAQKLIDQVDAEQMRHMDNAFIASYQPQLLALTNAMKADDPNDINNAKVALDTQWRAALQDLTKRRQTQQDGLNSLMDVTGRVWRIPEAVAAYLASAIQNQPAVAAAIEADNLAEAQTQRDRIIGNLGAGILQAATTWQAAASSVLDYLAAAPPPRGISIAASARFAKPAQDVSAGLKRIGPATTADTTAEIHDALVAIQTERASVEQVLDSLVIAINAEVAFARAEVIRLIPPDWNDSLFDGLERAAKDFSNWLNKVADAPDPDQPAEQSNTFHQAWTVALQKQFDTPNAAVTAKLNANLYAEAAQAAINAKLDGLLIAAAAPGATPSFTAPAFLPRLINVPTPQTIRTTFQTLFTPAPVIPTLVTARAKLKKDKLAQSLMVGVVLIVAGYGTQLGTFVGTFTDFSTLFFWAFGLDLTVDAIARVSKKPS